MSDTSSATPIKYLEASEVSEVKVTSEPRYRQTATGYGRKLQTHYMIRIGTRWYRVYCVCYSNVGSLYIIRKGEWYFASRIEYMLEDARDAQKAV